MLPNFPSVISFPMIYSLFSNLFSFNLLYVLPFGSLYNSVIINQFHDKNIQNIFTLSFLFPRHHWLIQKIPTKSTLFLFSTTKSGIKPFCVALMLVKWWIWWWLCVCVCWQTGLYHNHSMNSIIQTHIDTRLVLVGWFSNGVGFFVLKNKGKLEIMSKRNRGGEIRQHFLCLSARRK